MEVLLGSNDVKGSILKGLREYVKKGGGDPNANFMYRSRHNSGRTYSIDCHVGREKPRELEEALILLVELGTDAERCRVWLHPDFYRDGHTPYVVRSFLIAFFAKNGGSLSFAKLNPLRWRSMDTLAPVFPCLTEIMKDTADHLVWVRLALNHKMDFNKIPDLFIKDLQGVLRILCRYGSLADVDAWTERKARMMSDRGSDYVESPGDTLLVCACRREVFDDATATVVNRFIADVTGTSQDGSTALHAACAVGDLPLALRLIELGADMEARTKDGSTALHFACAGGNLPLALRLIELGADMEARTKDGSTALHAACAVGNLPLALRLIELGADVEARTKLGKTSLYSAVEGGRPEVVQALLLRGCDFNARENGKSALYRLCELGVGGFGRHTIDTTRNKDTFPTPSEVAENELDQARYINVACLLISRDAEICVNDHPGSGL
eukprot:TRINITY_DN1066_c0_g1_i1.p1 TRINITY_DN1066_c0_g1~~TRINITY_DN1066_c0_g1_i1.p1  ORF type:complete len:442 (+),score=58.85 TRINITY_DN1066_c0_g1_i1:170-1495(+)